MGVSKKKFAKQIKTKTEDTIITFEEQNKAKRDEKAAATLSFSTNVNKENLKQKREKLRADRFKAIEYNTTSKTETVLRKRAAQAAENRKKDNITIKKVQVSNRKIDDEFEMNDLMDIWGEDRKVTSNKMESYRNSYAKKDQHKIKAVMLPKGGLSYNPRAADHKALLKTVAAKEEEIVEKNLKDLQKVRPLLYSENQAGEQDDKSSEEEQHSSDEEPVDPDANLAVNEAVSRTKKIKTQTDRNKIAETRAKLQAQKEKREKEKFNKDIERIENVMKQADNEAKHLHKKLDRQKREEHYEIQRQEKLGEVSKPKKVGRWKYQMRKHDYQLEDDLSGNLRQMKPLGNATLLDDRFDSIFRRNLLEPNAHDNLDKKRVRKIKYKINQRGVGNKTKELAIENAESKRRNDIREKGTKDIAAQEDVIVI